MSSKKTTPSRDRRRPQFHFEIKGGNLTLQTQMPPAPALRRLILAILLVTLIVLAIIRPDGWLDILRAILLILGPAFSAARWRTS